MRNSKSKVKVVKFVLSKCDDVVRCYSEIQVRYVKKLEEDPTVKSFQCNIALPGFSMPDDTGIYTTDFLITYTDGHIGIRECAVREYLGRPHTIKLLDASIKYWHATREINDWGIVINAEARLSKK